MKGFLQLLLSWVLLTDVCDAQTLFRDLSTTDSDYSYSYSDSTCASNVHSVDDDGPFAKVLGQSGKVKLGSTCPPEDDPNVVTLYVDYIKERDSDGDDVGTSGSVKHSMNTIANQDFTVSSWTVTEFEGICVNELNLTVDFDFDDDAYEDAALTVIVDIFCDDGEYVLAANTSVNETFSVESGDLKFSVLVVNWPFCNGTYGDSDGAQYCKQGQTAQYGSYLDVGLALVSKNEPTLVEDECARARLPAGVDDCDSDDDDDSDYSYGYGDRRLRRGEAGRRLGNGNGKSKATSIGVEYDLGGNASMVLSELTKIDGEWKEMDSGYPMYSSSVFELRFPRFSEYAYYDPSVSVAAAASSDTSSTTDDGDTGTDNSDVMTDDDDTSDTTTDDGTENDSTTDDNPTTVVDDNDDDTDTTTADDGTSNNTTDDDDTDTTDDDDSTPATDESTTGDVASTGNNNNSDSDGAPGNILGRGDGNRNVAKALASAAGAMTFSYFTISISSLLC